MKRFITLMLDCADTRTQAEFWTEALGYVVIEDGEPMVLASGPEGVEGPVLLLQEVADPKVAKNRMHIDVHTDDLSGEVDRLVGLGASRQSDEQADRGWCWVVMADPEGNEFCVCRPPSE